MEFTILSQKEVKFIKTCFAIQDEFVPTQNFFKGALNILFRRHAVAMIANHSRSIGPDTFIPYLAMNYFDRFFSMNKTFKEDVEGCNNDIEKVCLIAISCLSISAKIRMKDFSVEQFLRDNNLIITPQMIMTMESNILYELSWKIRPVTPFTYLNFYYRYFKRSGGYSRQCINEIVVQAQADHTLVHYPPNMIASTAFLAASKIAYPSKYKDIANPVALAILGPKEQVLECAEKILKLCWRMKIQIEIPESIVRFTSSKVVAVPQKQTEDRREKAAAVVVDSSEEEEEGTTLISRKRNTGKTSGTSQVQVAVKVVDKSDKKGVATEEIEAENLSLAKGEEKAVEVTETSEEEEEEEGTALIRRKRNMGKTTVTSEVQVPVKVEEVLVFDKSDKKGVATEEIEAENRSLAKGKENAVEVTETSVDDEARVDAIIRRALKKGKEVMGEEPQMQIGGSDSEILELVSPMNKMIFELKWPTEVLDIKQALPEEEETPVGVVNTVVLRKSATEARYNVRINNDTTILTLVTNCEKRVRKWIREKVSSTPVNEVEKEGPPAVMRIIGFKTKFVYEYGADEGLQKEDMFPEPCIMAFCYENHCLIYHLVPPVAEPNRTTYAGTSIFISQDVLEMLKRPENVFVGDGIQKEVELYMNDQVERLTAVDVIHHANPVFKYVSNTQSLTTLGSRVMNMKIVPNKLDSYAKWEDPNLAVQQLRIL